jgi:predicted nucleic acid-binding protein
MARIVVLDTWTLSLASQDPRKQDARRCSDWVRDLGLGGAWIAVPAIADFECRRELLRVGARAGILRLDVLIRKLRYLPVTGATMIRAAEYWAHVRGRGLGKPTAPDPSLDADCIIAAQASLATGLGDVMTIATPNRRHFVRFPGIAAELWESIVP